MSRLTWTRTAAGIYEADDPGRGSAWRITRRNSRLWDLERWTRIGPLLRPLPVGVGLSLRELKARAEL